jgi:hypothetical protein
MLTFFGVAGILFEFNKFIKVSSGLDDIDSIL